MPEHSNEAADNQTEVSKLDNTENGAKKKSTIDQSSQSNKRDLDVSVYEICQLPVQLNNGTRKSRKMS